MFNNIGSKIKKLALIISICMILIFISIGIILMVGAPTIWYIGLITIILGSVFSWLSVFFIYGFGELIENSAIIAGKQKLKDKKIKTNKGRLKSFSFIDEENTHSVEYDEEFLDNIPKENECPCCFHKIKKTDVECSYCGYKLK